MADAVALEATHGLRAYTPTFRLPVRDRLADDEGVDRSAEVGGLSAGRLRAVVARLLVAR
jgi:hypothetical protein